MLTARFSRQTPSFDRSLASITNPSISAISSSSSTLASKLNQLEPTHLSTALSTFTKNLVKAMPWKQKDNQVIMPFSMLQQCTFLAMMSDGVTKQELASTFGLTGDDLSGNLLKLANNASTTLQGIQNNLRSGASIWIDSGRSSYTPEAMRRLDAARNNGVPMELKSGDLQNGHELVNAWIESKTSGNISHLLKKGDVGKTTKFIVANFNLLNAKWKYPFTKYPTLLPFHTPDGSKNVQMMQVLNADLKYHSGDGFECFSLPYEAEAGLSVAIFLPNTGKSLGPTYQNLITDSSEGQNLMVKSLREMGNPVPKVSDHVLYARPRTRPPEKISVMMPIWVDDTSLDTKQVLKNMGVKAAFNPHDANFNGIIADGAVIDVMKDRTKIQFDETGTKVVSAGAAVGGSRASGNAKFIMVDRPFAYTIYAEETVKIKEETFKMPVPLVIGVVNDPTVNGSLST